MSDEIRPYSCRLYGLMMMKLSTWKNSTNLIIAPYLPLIGGDDPNDTLKTRSELAWPPSRSGSSTKCSKSMGSRSMASSNSTLLGPWASLGPVLGSSMLYNMLSRLWAPLIEAETPLTVMMVGPTWCPWRLPFCLAKAVAKADLWLLWLAVSLISLPPVVEDPASLEVSLPWRIQSSSASCRISARY